MTAERVAATPGRLVAWTLLSVPAVFWSQFCWVRATNFAGYDEWLTIWLSSRGIASFNVGNRPLQLLFDLPAPLLVPHSLVGFFVLHGTYLCLSGLLVFVLCGRLLPGHSELALLSGVFAAVWAPADLARLATVMTVAYSGVTFAMLLALLLLVESYRHENVLGLALACTVAVAAALTYESVLPTLVAAPLIVAAMARVRGARVWRWLVAWEAAVLGVSAMVVGHFLSADSYQRALGLDLSPLHVGQRLLAQFRFHLAPLVAPSPPELASLRVVLTGAVFLAVFGVFHRLAGGSSIERRHDGLYSRLMMVGLVLAALGYGLFLLSPGVDEANRTEFLSSPGIALFLSAFACLLAAWFPVRWRVGVAALFGAWVLSVGAARTQAMQREWDTLSFHPGQNGTLLQLTRLAPDLEPGTLVLLVGNVKDWPATFTFRPAVRYLYRDRASGYVMGVWPYLYKGSFDADAVRIHSYPALRGRWRDPSTTHRYHEAVVAHLGDAGELSLLEAWPKSLPPLPPGARYEPGRRILKGGTPLPEHGILIRSE